MAVIDTDSASPTRGQITYLPLSNSTIGSVHVDRSGRFAYFNDGCGIEVLDVNPSSPTYHTLVANLPAATANLESVADFTPDGKQLWWLEDGGYGHPSVIGVINTDATSPSYRTLNEFFLPDGSNPQGISISRDGTKAFLSMWGGTTIKVLNTSDFSTLTDISGGSGASPRGNVLSADGNDLWVATDGGNYLKKYDTNTLSFVTELFLDSGSNNIHFVRLSNDGRTAYEPGCTIPVLYQVDITTMPPTRLADVPMQSVPINLAIHP